MIRAFHTSATGMAAQQMVIDNTANNLSNMNTTGFKRSQVDFQDMIYAQIRQPGSPTVQSQMLPTGIQIGNGVRVAGTTRLFSTGPLQNTTNQWDAAIEGDGFFQITDPNNSQILYTRDGSFRVNGIGQLVTSNGYLIQPAVTLPANITNFSIGEDGTINVVTANSPTPQRIGQLTIARFANPAGLSGEGQNLFSQTAASGTPLTGIPGQNGMGTIRGGFLEGSNVDTVTELVNLIQAQRAYEFNTKAIKAADEMLSATNDLVR
jgi:flagellar basal-body rod protein FlgG